MDAAQARKHPAWIDPIIPENPPGRKHAGSENVIGWIEGGSGMEFGYRLMRGKNGASGFVRGMGERAMLSVQGLKPGEGCALFALLREEARLLEQKPADRDGRAQFLTAADQRLFLTEHGKVTLWEDGQDADET